MKPRVLIVDDSLTVRMDLREAFASIGFEASACESLAAARRALNEQAFALVVLDVLLPDGDGVALLREIKSAPILAGIPVILLSTEAEVRDRVRGFRTGADEYVGKPYDPANLLARARQLIGPREPQGVEPRTRLLLIDDSATFCREFKEVLENAGYGVVTAETGEEGLRTAVAIRPDAVIIDGVLSGPLDGAAVIRRLKDDVTLRNTPCLLLTGRGSTGDELRTYDAGADAYVRKETDTELILARIVALLRSLGPRVEEPAVAGLLGPKKILTVDDSPTYLNELDEELRKEGYDVIPARSGKEALELLEVQQVDCILLDLLMPEVSGQETCQIIKKTQAWRNIPLLILTAVEESRAMVQGINAGADDYISKSGDFEVLKARLRAQLRRKQFEDEYRAVREKLLQKEVEAAQARASKEIAEAKAAFEPLLRNEVWLNEVVRIAHLGAWEWDLSTNTQTWSDEQFRILGLVPGSVQPSNELFIAALDAEDRDRVVQAAERALLRENRYQIDFRIVRPGGELRYLICQGEICRDETGEPARVIGTMLDITERKQAENTIRQEADRHAALLSTTMDGYWRMDRKGKLLDVNDAYCRMSGYSRDELLQMHVAELDAVRTPEEMSRCIERLVEIGFERFETRHRKKNQEEFDVDVSASYLPAMDELLVFARDITRHKQAEREISSLNRELECRVRQRTAQLEAANEELESFSYSVSHDLRAPLRHMAGFLDLLNDHIGSGLDGTGRHYLEVVLDSVRQMGCLIDDLLAFSRAGRKEMCESRVDTALLFKRVREELTADLKGRTVDWIVGPLPVVMGDPALLKQVFVNLLSNALKYTGARTGAAIEVGCQESGEWVFFVRDNGVGFDMRYADKLFGVFQRLHSSDDYEGTGIGLALVRRIIGRHGGRTWAEGAVDRGATFYFSLPRAISEVHGRSRQTPTETNTIREEQRQ